MTAPLWVQPRCPWGTVTCRAGRHPWLHQSPWPSGPALLSLGPDVASWPGCTCCGRGTWPLLTSVEEPGLWKALGGHNMPYSVMLSKKTVGSLSKGTAFSPVAGRRSAGVRQWVIAFAPLDFFSFSPAPLGSPDLDSRVFCILALPILPASHWDSRWREQPVGA